MKNQLTLPHVCFSDTTLLLPLTPLPFLRLSPLVQPFVIAFPGEYTFFLSALDAVFTNVADYFYPFPLPKAILSSPW